MYPDSEAASAALDPPCRDASDNFILTLALACRADAIVSSDQDLLVLNPWNGIPILTPAQFLAQAEI
jgi:predicted nucleic acid-binding protein